MDRRCLNHDVSELEIKEVILQMGANKAASLDGFISLFFQRFRGTIGPAYTKFIHRIFVDGAFPRELNVTLISLILKIL